MPTFNGKEGGTRKERTERVRVGMEMKFSRFRKRKRDTGCSDTTGFNITEMSRRGGGNGRSKPSSKLYQIFWTFPLRPERRTDGRITERMVAEKGALLRANSSRMPPPPALPPRSRFPPALASLFPKWRISPIAASCGVGRIGRRRRYHSHHSNYHNAIWVGGHRHQLYAERTSCGL